MLPIQYREHHLPPFEVSEGPTLGGFKDKILIEERNLIQHGLYQQGVAALSDDAGQQRGISLRGQNHAAETAQCSTFLHSAITCN